MTVAQLWALIEVGNRSVSSNSKVARTPNGSAADLLTMSKMKAR